ncbi:hypothetical protein MSAN_01272100 [Mycena sanguinolenta]|uniref:Uncharacterized protein n=1 Tax=Mycena sanguinolenta TaxID=230812 RepID=A0A8H6YHN7_9AGAR|nr:hypothetical protein MSAN_01272100 [Mycena sanguinolenta]
MGNEKKLAIVRGITKYAAEAHRRSAAAYRRRNAEELREKARIRMALYRQRLKENDVDWEDRKERARISDTKYRKKHAHKIARKQRMRRRDAYIEKYGEEAYEERKTQKKIAREEKAAAIAQEMAEQQARDEAQAARRALLK